MRTPHRIVVASLVVLLAALWSVVPAQAATGTYVRLAHLSPDTPSVDVLVTSFADPRWSLRLPGVRYGDVSDYRRVDPGTYVVQMRAAGAADMTPPMVSTTLEVGEGSAHTVAGLGPRAGLALRVLDDDLTLPPPAQARVRVVAAAPAVATLDVRRAGVALQEHVPFGTATPYSTVPAGQGVLDIDPGGGATMPVGVRFAPGGVYTVLLLQEGNRVVPRVRTDATASGVVPAGGTETGLGGAADPPVVPILGLALGAAGLAAALLVGWARRRVRP